MTIFFPVVYNAAYGSYWTLHIHVELSPKYGKQEKKHIMEYDVIPYFIWMNILAVTGFKLLTIVQLFFHILKFYLDTILTIFTMYQSLSDMQ